MMSDWLSPSGIEGRLVSVVPLSMQHCDDLVGAISDDELSHPWQLNTHAPHSVRAEITRRLTLGQTGSMLPFAVIEKQTNRAIGMTSYLNFDIAGRKTEIETMCAHPSVRDSLYNTECQSLLLQHAFETLQYAGVEFRVHFKDMQSRRGIERLGARLDGVLRSNTYPANGSVRDTAVYSITFFDWLTIKANLASQLKENPTLEMASTETTKMG